MKKKVLLVIPSHKMTETPRGIIRYYSPVSLLNLASFLHDRRYECDIVNAGFEEIDWQKIKRGEYFLIGFSVIIGGFLKNARMLAIKAKEVNASVPICFGGIMSSIVPQQILEEYPAVDFIIRFEGEHTLFELCQYLSGIGSLSNINGLSYREDGRILHNPPRFLEHNLDNFPVPKWEILGKNCNKRQIPYLFNIFSSKGCPYRCSFCYKHSIDESIRAKSPAWRCRSAQHVISEIAHIHQLTESTVFTIGDDNFLVRRDRAQEILSYMRNNNFYIEEINTRMEHLNEEIIEAMSGVVQTVIYAIESASSKLQGLLNKNLNLKKIPDINKKLFNKGITTTHNFMIGLPTENDEDLRANVELAMCLKEINPYVRVDLYLYLPLPFTPLSNYIENEMNLPLPNNLSDYESANFDSSCKEGVRFRPWLAKERYEFLHKYSLVFRDAFQINNMELSKESLYFLNSDSKLRELFKGIEKVTKPKIFNRTYVLDRVLEKDHIDLANDLKVLTQ